MIGGGRDASAFDTLAEELENKLSSEAAPRWRDEEFDTLAARAFRLQFEGNAPFRAFCERRGVTPDRVRRWFDVPGVPATAFKHLDLYSAPNTPEAVFRTSGTSRGAEGRGRHPVWRLSLYRAAAEGPFHRHVLGGVTGARFISLVPSSEAAPESSLSYMVAAAAERVGRDVHWLVGSDGALDLSALEALADESERTGEPVALVGTALAFVHVVERLDRPLPPLAEGSSVMETGGFKGVSRTVGRDELHRRISATTGVPMSRIVNEYGMTELLSQLYEPVLSEGRSAAGEHVPAPTLRVRALDPETLEERPEGVDGILAFFDLANLGTVCHVLTEDFGSVRNGRVTLSGRLRGAEPRGCSRAMDELMTAAGSRR